MGPRRGFCHALLLQGFLLLSHSANGFADESFGEFKAELPAITDAPPIATPASKPAASSAPDPIAPLQEKPAPVVSGDADLSLFLKRLEDLGFDTKEIRAVAKKIEIFFRAPGGDAYAEWGYILDNLYIPHEFKEKGGNKIRYDLASHEIDTMIHELTHAARDVSAREDAVKGSPAREHYEAVKDIWASLRSGSLFFRFAWLKADEVSGYFMGAAISKVFEAAEDIVIYNTHFTGSKAANPEEAERLAGKLLIPTKETAVNSWDKGFITHRYAGPFGTSSVYDSASFKDNSLSGPALIHWEESPRVKNDMYNNILGLKPPRDIHDLLDRLNKADNDWIRGVRAKVIRARRASARNEPPPR